MGECPHCDPSLVYVGCLEIFQPCVWDWASWGSSVVVAEASNTTLVVPLGSNEHRNGGGDGDGNVFVPQCV